LTRLPPNIHVASAEIIGEKTDSEEQIISNSICGTITTTRPAMIMMLPDISAALNDNTSSQLVHIRIVLNFVGPSFSNFLV
jgi:hypothetical protein